MLAGLMLGTPFVYGAAIDNPFQTGSFSAWRKFFFAFFEIPANFQARMGYGPPVLPSFLFKPPDPNYARHTCSAAEANDPLCSDASTWLVWKYRHNQGPGIVERVVRRANDVLLGGPLSLPEWMGTRQVNQEWLDYRREGESYNFRRMTAPLFHPAGFIIDRARWTHPLFTLQYWASSLVGGGYAIFKSLEGAQECVLGIGDRRRACARLGYNAGRVLTNVDSNWRWWDFEKKDGAIVPRDP